MSGGVGDRAVSGSAPLQGEPERRHSRVETYSYEDAIAALVRERLGAETMRIAWKSPERGIVMWRRTLDGGKNQYPEWGVHSFRIENGLTDIVAGDYFPAHDEADAQERAEQAWKERV